MTNLQFWSVRVLTLLLCLAGTVGSADAQASNEVRARLTVPDSAHTQIVTLKDGSTIFGRILAVNGDTVSFQSQAGTIQLSAGAIKAIKEIAEEDVREGEYWFPNPNSTRLFFAPTGQMLKKGEGYFSDYELLFPGVAYGLTDNVTIGGGVSLIPAGVEDQVYYLTPKVGISVSDRVHLAAGMLFAGTQGGTGGIYYGVGTFGDGNASVTLGGGYGFAGGKIESKPVGMLGAEWRVARRLGLVTENYLLPVSDDNILYSFGVRFMGEKITTDLALVNVVGSGVIGVPYVDFVFRF
ncbi:MAG TPA: hypothetical protein VEK37_05595 [Gemmatimonadaceae bacterium]|nr:hypothetical protein [Gemmatimonadaceae bacterium]